MYFKKNYMFKQHLKLFFFKQLLFVIKIVIKINKLTKNSQSTYKLSDIIKDNELPSLGNFLNQTERIERGSKV